MVVIDFVGLFLISMTLCYFILCVILFLLVRFSAFFPLIASLFLLFRKMCFWCCVGGFVWCFVVILWVLVFIYACCFSVLMCSCVGMHFGVLLVLMW